MSLQSNSGDGSAPEMAPRSQRASDRERERTAEILRTAATEGRLSFEELDARLTAAFSAVTREELRELVTDLPGGARNLLLHSAARGRRNPTKFGSAVMGGMRQTGVWLVAPRCSFMTVMGGSEIDLNAAELAGSVTTLRVLSIMGGTTVRVPVGLDVRVSRLAVMGHNDVELGSFSPVESGPVLRIRLLTILGAAKVRRGRRSRRRLPSRPQGMRRR